jgi:hypothetical protein
MIEEIVELAVFLFLFASLIIVCRAPARQTSAIPSGSAKSMVQAVDVVAEENTEGTQ